MTDFITVTYKESTIGINGGEISLCGEKPQATITPRKAIIRKDTITRILEVAQGSIIFMNDGAALAVVETVREIKESMCDTEHDWSRNLPEGKLYYAGEEGKGQFDNIEQFKKTMEKLDAWYNDSVDIKPFDTIKVDGDEVRIYNVFVQGTQKGVLYQKIRAN